MNGAGFILDLGRCVGCGACVLACRMENHSPTPGGWRRVVTLNQGRVPGGPTYHLSLACHHCQNPACRKACPSDAYDKRRDGVVAIDPERCLGCRYCEMACPFHAPSFDPEGGVMTKCSLCSHRLDQDLLPACVSACPTEALQFRQPDQTGGDSSLVPGFPDPAGCKPGIAFVRPRGRIRIERLKKLLEALGK